MAKKKFGLLSKCSSVRYTKRNDERIFIVVSCHFLHSLMKRANKRALVSNGDHLPDFAQIAKTYRIMELEKLT